MAVYHKLSKLDVEDIISNYSVGRVKSFRGLEDGVVHSNFKVNTSRKSYVLRIFSPSVGRSLKAIQFEMKLLHFMDEHRFPIPGPVKRKDEKYVGEFKGDFFAVYDFMKGAHPKKVTVDYVKQVGAALAKMHNLTKGHHFPGEKTREFHTNLDYIKGSARGVIKELRKKKGVTGVNELERLLRRSLNRKVPRNMPKGVLHADFSVNNAFFYKGKLSAMLDFDDSHYGYLIDDLTSTIVDWGYFWEPKLAKPLFEAYDIVRPLTSVERKHFIDSLIIQSSKAVAYGCGFFYLWAPKKKVGNVMKEERVLNLIKVMGDNSLFKP